MGQTLFWIGAAVASVLFVPFFLSVVSRYGGPDRRKSFDPYWRVFVHPPWVVAVAMLLMQEAAGYGGLVELLLVTLAGAAVVVAGIHIERRGLAGVAADGTAVPAPVWRVWRAAWWRYVYLAMVTLGVLVLAAVYIQAIFKGDLILLLLSIGGWMVVQLLAVVTLLVGRKAPPAGDAVGVDASADAAAAVVRVATTWNRGVWAALWLVASLATAVVFWNLDQAVRQEMATMKGDASALALSVAPPRVADTQNAATLYRQAWEALVARSGDVLDARSTREDTDENALSLKITRWLPSCQGESCQGGPASDDPQMLEYLVAHGPVLDLVRQAARMPGCDFGINYHLPTVGSLRQDINHMQHLRALARLICLSARVAADRGEAAAAMEDIHTVLAMADHYANDPTLTGMLGAASVAANAFDAFQYAMDRVEMTADGVAAISPNARVSFQRRFNRSVRLEAACGISMFTTTDPMMAFIAADTDTPPSLYNLGGAAAALRVFQWRSDVRAYLRWMRRYERLSSLPWHEAAEGWREVSREYDEGSRQIREGIGGLLGSMSAKSCARTAGLAAEADAKRRLMILGVAMWRYQLAEGIFPDELDSLTPTYLPAVPVDPFTGQGMKMSRAPDGRVVIYSVGPDQKDDGGEPRDTNARAKRVDDPVPGDIALVLGTAAISGEKTFP